MRRRAYLVALIALLPGCSDTTGPVDRVSGPWSGTRGRVTMDLLLAREGTHVTGSGNLRVDFGSSSVSVAGTFIHPNISLVLSAAGFEDANLTGTVDRGVMSGRINGSGFTNFAIVLQRE